MRNRLVLALLISVFTVGPRLVAAADEQPIKLPPQGVVNSIEPANILISLDTSGSMSGRNMNNAVDAIHRIVTKFNSVANFGLVRWNSGYSYDDRGRPVIPITTTSKSSNDQILRATQAYKRGGFYATTVFRWGGGTRVDTGGIGYPRTYFYGPGRNLTGGSCAKTVVILISDGGWSGRERSAAPIAASLLRDLGVITVVIGIDAVHGVGSSRWNAYNTVSSNGGGGAPLFSRDAVQMEQALTDKLSAILAESFSATSPAVMASQQFGQLVFQPTFEYRSVGQWKGSLKAYSLDTVATDATLKWDFGEVLQRMDPGQRRLWTVDPRLPSPASTGLRNFSDNYQTQFLPILGGLGRTVTKQIINFVQGYDVYDDDKDGQYGAYPGERYRRWMLGDIFHSKPIYVGPPQELDDSDTDKVGVLGYFESLRPGAHAEFVKVYRGRRPIVLAASNSGVLHAVDASIGLAKSGSEVWGFVPPPLLDKLQLMAPTNSTGASQARYMIDGAITVRDVFVNNIWRTYAAFGYGLGARAFTVLDVTEIDSPKHVISIENEWTGSTWRIKVWDKDGNVTDKSNDPGFAEYRQLGYSTSSPIFTFHKNGSGNYSPVLIMGAGAISRPPAMELESSGGTRRPSTGNNVFLVSLDGTVGRILKGIPLHNPASLYSGCTAESCAVPFNQQIADIEIIEGGGSSVMNGAFGVELFIPNYTGSIQTLNLSAMSPRSLTNLTNPVAIFDPGRMVTNLNDRVITVPISISGLTHEKTDGKLNITFGTGDMQQLSIKGKVPYVDNKVYSLQGDESSITDGKQKFSVGNLVDVSAGATACPMPSGKLGWQLSINRLNAKNEDNQSTTFLYGKVASKVIQYGGSTVIPVYKPRIDGQCSIGDSGIYLFDSICGSTRQSQVFNNAMLGGVTISGDTLVMGISGGKGRKRLNSNGNEFQKIDNLIIGKGVFDSKNISNGKGTATIYNKQRVR
jgi:hypothetical protein